MRNSTGEVENMKQNSLGLLINGATQCCHADTLQKPASEVITFKIMVLQLTAVYTGSIMDNLI